MNGRIPPPVASQDRRHRGAAASPSASLLLRDLCEVLADPLAAWNGPAVSSDRRFRRTDGTKRWLWIRVAPLNSWTLVTN